MLEDIPDIKILSSDQDGKGSREGGMAAMQGYLTRFPSIDGVFAINDPQAIGSDLAAKQLNRTGIVITSVDGAPDIVSRAEGQHPDPGLREPGPVRDGQAGGARPGYDIMNGKKPADPMILMQSKLVTRDNVGQYQGWTH